MESGTKTAFSSGPGDTRHSGAGYPGSYVHQGETSKQAILAAAVSHDGKYLATAGMDRRVHIWDTTSHTHIKAFPGHKDIVTVTLYHAYIISPETRN
jgi:WD40 repeat protein